ncbi:MAG: hypothetical protein EBE86_035305 [Hormoscilla sp. GUM202]|nr:hypothetical protein [Hormoscilla sp. GUM202]
MIGFGERTRERYPNKGAISAKLTDKHQGRSRLPLNRLHNLVMEFDGRSERISFGNQGAIGQICPLSYSFEGLTHSDIYGIIVSKCEVSANGTNNALATCISRYGY